MGRRKSAHASKISWPRAHIYACVRWGVASRPGYLSVTRWQAYAPGCFPMGWCKPRAQRLREKERAEGGGHNFQIYVQMFLATTVARGAFARTSLGEDAYRKVSRNWKMLSRRARRAMMEHGVDQPRPRVPPLHIRETSDTTGRDDELQEGGGRRDENGDGARRKRTRRGNRSDSFLLVFPSRFFTFRDAP